MRLADNQLSWQQDQQTHQVGLRGGLLQWQRLGDGWQLASHQLEVRGDEPQWRPWHIQLDSQQGHLSGRIDPVSLRGITPVLALLAGESSVSADALRQMQPAGELQGLTFERRESDGRWQLAGQLHDLRWHRWQMVVGIRELNGDFVLDAQGGQANLSLGPQTVQVGPYFPKDIPIDALSGRVQWQSQAQGWQLRGEQILLSTPALQAATDFRLELPKRRTHVTAYCRACGSSFQLDDEEGKRLELERWLAEAGLEPLPQSIALAGLCERCRQSGAEPDTRQGFGPRKGNCPGGRCRRMRRFREEG